MASLIDNLPISEKNALRRVMSDLFEKYRIFKYYAIERREAKITLDYEPRFHGQTNVTSDQTAQTAVYNVTNEAERKAFVEEVENAVNRLPLIEMQLIRSRYLAKEEPFDFEVFNCIVPGLTRPISQQKYTKIRNRAFYKLAGMVGVDWTRNLFD